MLTGLVLSALIAAPTFAQKASSPYKLEVFAKAPPGLTAPDSIAVLGDHVFVGYGDGHLPDGTDGLNSQVVEFAKDGSVVHIYSVPGHSDGLKVDPRTHLLWALQNEDANANLVIINPANHDQKLYTFGPTLHGGGYDDIVFRGCKVYISASNPAKNPNTGAAIVSADLAGNTVVVHQILAGDAKAINIPSETTLTLNLQDPDSMTSDPFGNLVMTSQADQELIIVNHPESDDQRVLRLPLSFETSKGLTRVEVDDTVFATSTEGFVLFADKSLNTVYKLTKSAFVPGTAYTAADGGQFVGTVDLNTGVITPVVTGLGNPGGMAFVDTFSEGKRSEGRGSEGKGWQGKGDDWSHTDADACRDSESH
jgi:hypothetical protein